MREHYRKNNQNQSAHNPCRWFPQCAAIWPGMSPRIIDCGQASWPYSATITLAKTLFLPRGGNRRGALRVRRQVFTRDQSGLSDRSRGLTGWQSESEHGAGATSGRYAEIGHLVLNLSRPALEDAIVLFQGGEEDEERFVDILEKVRD